MKRVMILLGVMFMVGISVPSYAKDKANAMGQMAHHKMMKTDTDKRVSLNLPPHMKQHQLTNMRSHLEAVQKIIGLLADGKFDEASNVAHNKLGLTPEMKKMCDKFPNDDFRKLGLGFHKSADELGDVLKTGNMKRSLDALHKTMSSCVRCHAKFRQ